MIHAAPPSSEREADLMEQITQLRQQLRVEPDRVRLAKIITGLGLPRCDALILLALYEAGNTWLPKERLDMALPERLGDPRGEDQVRVHVYRIRKALLSPDAVLCRVGVGYTIGAPGILACRRVLGE